MEVPYGGSGRFRIDAMAACPRGAQPIPPRAESSGSARGDRLVDQKQIGQQRAQMNGGIEIVDQL